MFVSPGMFAALAFAGLMLAREPHVEIPVSVYAGERKADPEAGFDAAVALAAAEAEWSAPDDEFSGPLAPGEND